MEPKALDAMFLQPFTDRVKMYMQSLSFLQIELFGVSQLFWHIRKNIRCTKNIILLELK